MIKGFDLQAFSENDQGDRTLHYGQTYPQTIRMKLSCKRFYTAIANARRPKFLGGTRTLEYSGKQGLTVIFEDENYQPIRGNY